jgi:hypothetical protein
MNADPSPALVEAARWEAVAQIRRARPRKWVVIWAPRKGGCQARPRFPAPPGTVATGATAQQFTGAMNTVDLAARRSGG